MNEQTTLKFANLTKDSPPRVIISPDLDYVTFRCAQPTIIQSSEIQKVKIGIACEIPFGCFLQISTYPQLAEQAAELFPALTVIDHTHEGELVLAVRNHGRGPLNLMPETPVAIGRMVKLELLKVEGFEYEASKPESRQSQPQKKNPFSFEVK